MTLHILNNGEKQKTKKQSAKAAFMRNTADLYRWASEAKFLGMASAGKSLWVWYNDRDAQWPSAQTILFCIKLKLKLVKGVVFLHIVESSCLASLLSLEVILEFWLI